MILREALRSLKNSGSKAVFYVLTFFLTTALMFAYFNMEYAVTSGKTEIYLNSAGLGDLAQMIEKGNAGNLMLVFIVVMCAVDLFYCNSFYVKNKAQELGVRLICGATYIQLAMYLLIQTLVMLAVAIPFGILCGYGLIALINTLLANAGETVQVAVSGYAVAEFVSTILFILLWTLMLNCSFAYKSGAVLLSGGNIAVMKDKSSYGLMGKKIFRLLVSAAAFIIALLPLFMLFNGTGALAVGMAIGSWGLSRVLTEILPPFLTWLNRKKGTADTVRMTAVGFLRRDIMFSNAAVCLLLCDLLVVISMLFSRENTRLEYLLVLMTYICISILQSMTVMFRLETDLSSRGDEYVILSQVGTSEEDRKKITRGEILRFYGLVFLLVVIYGGMAMFALCRDSLASTSQILLLSAAALVPVIISGVLTLIYYRQVAAAGDVLKSR